MGKLLRFIFIDSTVYILIIDQKISHNFAQKAGEILKKCRVVGRQIRISRTKSIAKNKDCTYCFIINGALNEKADLIPYASKSH